MMAFTKTMLAHTRVADETLGARTSRLIEQFVADENGATAIEYGLIVSLIFLAVVGAIRSVSDETVIMYDEIEGAMAGTN